MQLLIDTGAGVSLLSQSAYQGLGARKPKMKSSKTNLTTANGEPLESQGTCRLSFRLDGQRFSHDMVIGDLSGISGILGMDFLIKNGAEIDIASGVLRLHGRAVKLCRESTSMCARIKVTDTVSVPPHSEMFVKAKVAGEWAESAEEGLIEPLTPSRSGNAFDVPRAMVKVSGGEIFVPVTNWSDHPFKIRSGTVVASLQTVDCPMTEQEKRDGGDSDGQKVEGGSELPEPLKALLTSVHPEVSQETREDLKSLVEEFQGTFYETDGTLGRSGKTKHKIDTQGNPPIKLPPRRAPIAQREVIEQEVKKMLDAGVIQPSDSPWAAPIVLVRKKDGSVRFCVDFRKLNSVTKKDAYPLPRIDESLDLLSGSKWFSTLDLAQGYFQVEMDEADKEKTAFNTHVGHYHFLTMPFGLTNSGSTFQRLMELTLKGLGFDRVLCYIDDVIVMGKTEKEALANLRLVLERFRDANLKLKAKKCSLFQKQVEFLGHVVSEEGIKCDPNKVSAVLDWPVPTNVTEVRSFLGLASYYRKFIPDFSGKASPLTNLTRKGQKFEWDEGCERAFNQLKQDLVSAPILAYPQSEGLFILDTDASAHSVGGVLSQVQDGTERVIAYASKTLCHSRQRYCVTYRELYAVVTFVKHFRHFLWGRKFLIRTDHSSLKWLKNFKNPEGMIARWIATLDTYHFDIEYRKGSQHGNSDALSRKPYRRCKREDCQDCQTGGAGVSVVTRSQAKGEVEGRKGAGEGDGTQRKPDSRNGGSVPVRGLRKRNGLRENERASV